MRRSLVAFAIFFSACNSDHGTKTATEIALSVDNESLLFSAIDPSAWPWASSLFKLDLKNRSVSEVLTGESSDVAVFSNGDSALFFNRSSSNQNFRLLSPEVDTYLLSPQQQFAKGETGDPHDLVSLGNDKVLLAHYVEGSLVVMDQKTGAEVQVIDADWDLPEGVPFKPETLLPVSLGTKKRIYVVHQGAATISNKYLTNGSQQVFVLEVAGDRLVAIDLDPKTEKVQGIKLKGSIPAGVKFSARTKPLLVSMCSRTLAETQSCHSAIEEIDPQSDTASVLWDLDDAPYFMNGTITPGPDGQVVFVSVEEKLADTVYEKRLLRMNLDDKSISTAYTYAEGSAGFYGAFFDDTSRTLFVGDVGNETIGKFVVIPESGEQSEIPLPLVPYSGAFLPAATKK